MVENRPQNGRGSSISHVLPSIAGEKGARMEAEKRTCRRQGRQARPMPKLMLNTEHRPGDHGRASEEREGLPQKSARTASVEPFALRRRHAVWVISYIIPNSITS